MGNSNSNTSAVITDESPDAENERTKEKYVKEQGSFAKNLFRGTRKADNKQVALKYIKSGNEAQEAKARREAAVCHIYDGTKLS